jgi:hypothetical protein
MQEVFDFSLHKISNGVVCNLLSLLSAGLQMAFQQNTNYIWYNGGKLFFKQYTNAESQIATRPVYLFIGHMGVSTFGLIKN